MSITVEQQQLNDLAHTLEDMSGYICRLEQGCAALPAAFLAEDKSQPLGNLSHILEGIGYYHKLLQSAIVLLAIDPMEDLLNNISVCSFTEEIHRTFTSVFQAAEGEDYSLVADLIEYDLIPVVHTARQLLEVMLHRYTERVV